jgi:hypothetical protein
MPAARSRLMPRPATRGCGSRQPTTTLAIPASIKASAQGPVRPRKLQGSRVVAIDAPRSDRSPCRFREFSIATISACGPPGGLVVPRPRISSPRKTTAPTLGFGCVRPSPLRAADSAAFIIFSSRARSAAPRRERPALRGLILVPATVGPCRSDRPAPTRHARPLRPLRHRRVLRSPRRRPRSHSDY